MSKVWAVFDEDADKKVIGISLLGRCVDDLNKIFDAVAGS